MAEINPSAFMESLAAASSQKDTAANLGAEFARQGVRRIFLVGCGAPNRLMAAIKYFLDRDIKTIEFHLYLPAEFVRQKPAKLDQDSLVVFASHSGKTAETVKAAEFIKPYGCKSAAVTQFEDSPLATSVGHTLCYGKCGSGYYASFILLAALLAGFVKEAENWLLAGKLIRSLDALPQVLLDTELKNDKRAAEEARNFQREEFYIVLGSGPCRTTAYVTGVCIMMEMLCLRVFTGEAAEFFHGPFEVLDVDVPVLIYVGEDESRPIAERAVRFCEQHTQRLLVYDSKTFPMEGVDEDIRPIFAPFVLDAATERLMQHLADLRSHPLTTRRYMGKLEY